MKLQITHCSAHRPDKRAIAKLIEELAPHLSAHEARAQTEYLLDGTPLEIDIEGHATGSAFRALRKLSLEYDLME